MTEIDKQAPGEPREIFELRLERDRLAEQLAIGLFDSGALIDAHNCYALDTILTTAIRLLTELRDDPARSVLRHQFFGDPPGGWQ